MVSSISRVGEGEKGPVLTCGPAVSRIVSPKHGRDHRILLALSDIHSFEIPLFLLPKVTATSSNSPQSAKFVRKTDDPEGIDD
jgi:hypothetical protein